MKKSTKYIILLICMLIADFFLYGISECTSANFNSHAIPLVVIFAEVAIYSTLILIEITSKGE